MNDSVQEEGPSKPKGKNLSKGSLQPPGTKISQPCIHGTHQHLLTCLYNQVRVLLYESIIQHYVIINQRIVVCQCRFLADNVLHEGLKVKLENLIVGQTPNSYLLLVSTKSTT